MNAPQEFRLNERLAKDSNRRLSILVTGYFLVWSETLFFIISVLSWENSFLLGNLKMQ